MASLIKKTLQNYKLGTTLLRTLYIYNPKNYKHSTKKKLPDNVGMQTFIEDFQITEEDIDELGYNFDHYEEFGQLEDRITHLDKLEHEVNTHKRQTKSIALKKIVEKKGGFKPPKETNLLTYEAKCQIRYLHTKDPKEWTPERIAECFPISPEGAKRLLKNDRLLPLKEVKRHNEAVAKNWELLKAGSPDVSPVTLALYKEKQWPQHTSHLNLTLPQPETLPLKPDYSQPDYSLPEKLGPFLSIVKVHVRQKQKEIRMLQEAQMNQQKAQEEAAKTTSSPSAIIDDTESSLAPSTPNNNNKVTRATHKGKSSSKSSRSLSSHDVALKPPPLDPLKSSVFTTIDDMKNASYIHPDRENLGTPMTHELFKESMTLNLKEFCKDRSKSVDAQRDANNSSSSMYSIENYLKPSCNLNPDPSVTSKSPDLSVIPEVSKVYADDASNQETLNTNYKAKLPKERRKINIPKKLRKRGALYKVNNCYYDDEGEFLYEAPY